MSTRSETLLPFILGADSFVSSKAKRGFDLQSFNAGNYEGAVESSNSAEQITSVLYPNDNHSLGKELRQVISHNLDISP